MSEQKTVGKMLRLLRLLVFNVSKPIAVVAQRSDMSIRTVYRYLETFKSAGMTVTRRYGTVYTVELGVLEMCLLERQAGIRRVMIAMIAIWVVFVLNMALMCFKRCFSFLMVYI